MMPRHASEPSVSSRAVDTYPNPPVFAPGHCGCLPCRMGLPNQHLRRHEVSVGAVSIGAHA